MSSSMLNRKAGLPPPVARYSIANSFYGSDFPHGGVIDMSSGAGVTCLGHTQSGIKAAMIQQLNEMPYAHSAQWTSDVVEKAGRQITERASEVGGGGFREGGVSFYSGGAEAVEAACKIAMQFLLTAGTNEGLQIAFASRRHSYHGASLFTLALGDHPRKRVIDLQWSIVDRVQRFAAYAPNALLPADHNTNDQLAHQRMALDDLKATAEILWRARHQIVVVIETIGGTTLGIAPTTPEYLAQVRAIVDQYEGVLIYDEILSGNYRTGELMAWQHYQKRTLKNVAPDIAVMGKGITGGYFPMSCVLVNQRIRNGIELETGSSLWHTSTNQNHPIGCAALNAAMNVYDALRADMIELSRKMHMVVAPRLRELDVVKSVQGEGCLWGVSLLDGYPELHLAMKQHLADNGITAYTDGGTVNGKGNMVLFAPPYTISEAELARIVEAFETFDIGAGTGQGTAVNA